MAFTEKGLLNNAISDFGKYIKYDPDDDYSYIYRGIAYFKKGSLEKAFSDFTTAIWSGNRSGKAYYWRGMVFAQIGFHKNAISSYDKGLEISESPVVCFQLGKAYEALGLKGKAKTAFAKAKELEEEVAA